MNTITNKDLKTISNIAIIDEALNEFIFEANEILDIYLQPLETIKKQRSQKNSFTIKSGKITISKHALKKLPSDLKPNKKGLVFNEPAENFNFINTLTPDIVGVQIKFNNGKILSTDAPYNPLLQYPRLVVVEHSNCPSFYTDKDNNLVLLFGNLSTAPTRVDNNYLNLIENLPARLHLPKSKLWKIHTVDFQYEKKSQQAEGVFEFQLSNNKKIGLHLKFLGVHDLNYSEQDQFLYSSTFLASKLATEEILVQGDIFSMLCKKIVCLTEQ